MATVTPLRSQERRLHTRHRARTKVSIKPHGSPTAVLRTAANLSATGVAVVTEGMGLKVGQVCDLAFMINLGDVTKIHRRTARVAHVTGGITGFYMEKFTG